MYIFRKMYIFVIIFHDFALRIETGSAKEVVKPILRIRNVIDRC